MQPSADAQGGLARAIVRWFRGPHATEAPAHPLTRRSDHVLPLNFDEPSRPTEQPTRTRHLGDMHPSKTDAQ